MNKFEGFADYPVNLDEFTLKKKQISPKVCVKLNHKHWVKADYLTESALCQLLCIIAPRILT